MADISTSPGERAITTNDTTASTGQPFDPPAGRRALRLTTVYATTASADAATGRRPSTLLRLGRLTRFYDASADQLPSVLAHAPVDPTGVEFLRFDRPVTNAWAWLFSLPSGEVAAAVTLDVDADLLDVIPALEDLYYADVTVSGHPLGQHFATLAEPLHLPGLELDTERHQLVFAHPGPDAMPSDDVLQRLVYRADLPARATAGTSAICYPAELNRRPTMRGALGPYVSVVIGQQDYVENAAFLTAVHVVTAGARLRQIRQEAYAGVAALRSSSQDDALTSRDRRLTLEDVAAGLRSLELDLSYSVEAVADLGMLIPALRVESYHQALTDSTKLTQRVSTTGRMLERLANAIDAELTSVQSIEARRDDARRTRTAVAVTFVTTVAGTVGLLFAFLGINAREVDPTRSMFDARYLPIYLTIAAVAAGGLAVFLGMAHLDRRRLR